MDGQRSQPKNAMGRPLYALAVKPRKGRAPIFLAKHFKLGLSPLSTDSLSLLAHPPGENDGTHSVQLYTDDGFLLGVLGRYIGTALRAGDAALVIATRAHRAGVEECLQALEIDLRKATHEGRYILLDAHEILAQVVIRGTVQESTLVKMIEEILGTLRGAPGSPPRRTVIFGELVALLWTEGKQEQAIQLEELWNRLAQKHSFSLLCAYPVAGFDGDTDIGPFARMCAAHSEVVPTENYFALKSERERLGNIAHLQRKSQMLDKLKTAHAEETQFRLFVDAVRDYAIFILDREGRVSSWNSGAERIKGYKASEIIGRHFSCFYPQEDLRNGKPGSHLIAAAEAGRFEDEGWRIRKDGSRFWANVVITAIRNHAGELVGFGKVTRDFTDKMLAAKALQDEVVQRQRAQMGLQESERALRDLSLHLLRTQDEERRRIGRDLHDSLGQCLAVLKMKLDSLAAMRASEDAHELTQCVHLVEESIKEVRTIAYLLYPPMLEEMGLKSAIPWYLDGFAARSGIKTTFEISPDFWRLSRDAEVALFRVLQESLTNVHRHSGSGTADVRLSREENNGVLEVSDEGRGISPTAMHSSAGDRMADFGIGLRGMRERLLQLGGSLEVTSTEGGTTIRASVPLPA